MDTRKAFLVLATITAACANANRTAPTSQQYSTRFVTKTVDYDISIREDHRIHDGINECVGRTYVATTRRGLVPSDHVPAITVMDYACEPTVRADHIVTRGQGTTANTRRALQDIAIGLQSFQAEQAARRE